MSPLETLGAVTYFIRSGQLLKIGVTNDLRKRFTTYQLHNPTCQLLGWIEGDAEPKLHTLFRQSLRYRREWFIASKALLKIITQHPNFRAYTEKRSETPAAVRSRRCELDLNHADPYAAAFHSWGHDQRRRLTELRRKRKG